MALLALAYCVSMNIIGAFLGVGATFLIKPGGRLSTNSTSSRSIPNSSKGPRMSDIAPDFLRNMVSDNILKTLLYSTVTTYVQEPAAHFTDEKNATQVYRRVVGTTSGPNVLGVLVSSLVIGLAAGSGSEKTVLVITLAEAVTEVMTILVEKIIVLLPFAMISLIASTVANMDQLDQSLIALALFVATAACYLSIMTLLVLPLFYFAFVRENLFRLYRAFTRPMMTAFSVGSSLVALPDLFRACDHLNVDPQLVRTIAPFLTSFNANGSSAFIASAVVFAAQMAQSPLNIVQMIGTGFLAGINVMALPAVPSASIITVYLISRVFGVPESMISILFVVEFIVDRLRTLVNVISHGTCILFVFKRTSSKAEENFNCADVETVYAEEKLVTAVQLNENGFAVSEFTTNSLANAH
ncbi:unnamed protein product [Calicophoron daubneyi]|uniref:Amino acid transporter n=1 Tax=Calicophoron daubneyi TaxID=300641 RepID=A0AAV2THH1_CALDB